MQNNNGEKKSKQIFERIETDLREESVIFVAFRANSSKNINHINGVHVQRKKRWERYYVYEMSCYFLEK